MLCDLTLRVLNQIPSGDFAKVIAQALGEGRNVLRRVLDIVRDFLTTHGGHISLGFDLANFVLHLVSLILGWLGSAARGVAAAATAASSGAGS